MNRHPLAASGFRFKRNLKFKIWLGVGLTCALSFIVLQTYLYRSARADSLNVLLLEARTLATLLKASGEVFHETLANSGLPITGDRLDLLPIHALARISEELRAPALSDLSIRIVSKDSPNRDHRPAASDAADMDYFERHRSAAERLTDHRDATGVVRYHYAQPIWVDGDCLICHGQSAGQVSREWGERHAPPLGYRPGDLRAILSIQVPSAPIEQRTRALFLSSLLGHLTVFTVLFILVGLLLQRFVIDRLGHLERATQALTAGDYASPIAVTGHDELADLAVAFNQMAARIGQRERQLADSEERWRLFIEHAPVALAMFDREMR